jgi:hypothetical protein
MCRDENGDCRVPILASKPIDSPSNSSLFASINPSETSSFYAMPKLFGNPNKKNRRRRAAAARHANQDIIEEVGFLALSSVWRFANLLSQEKYGTSKLEVTLPAITHLD